MHLMTSVSFVCLQVWTGVIAGHEDPIQVEAFSVASKADWNQLLATNEVRSSIDVCCGGCDPAFRGRSLLMAFATSFLTLPVLWHLAAAGTNCGADVDGGPGSLPGAADRAVVASHHLAGSSACCAHAPYLRTPHRKGETLASCFAC